MGWVTKDSGLIAGCRLYHDWLEGLLWSFVSGYELDEVERTE